MNHCQSTKRILHVKSMLCKSKHPKDHSFASTNVRNDITRFLMKYNNTSRILDIFTDIFEPLPKYKKNIAH